MRTKAVKGGYVLHLLVVLSVLGPSSMVTDDELRSRELMRKYGRKGEIVLSRPTEILPAETLLAIPGDFVVPSPVVGIDFRRTFRNWVQSGRDGAGYYKMSNGHYDYFLPVYTEAEMLEARRTKRAPVSSGLIAYRDLVKADDRMKTRKEAPIYAPPSDLGNPFDLTRICEAGIFPLVPPVDPVLQEVAITSPFGYRSRDSRRHAGIDIKAPAGTPVRASAKGKIELVGLGQLGFGHYVIIDHGHGVRTLYAHLAEDGVAVKPGDHVKAGQIIAKVGNSGHVRGVNGGYHLHYEVQREGRTVDPEFEYLYGAYNRDFREPGRGLAGEKQKARKRKVSARAKPKDRRLKEPASRLDSPAAFAGNGSAAAETAATR